jgi:hypothetical protein
MDAPGYVTPNPTTYPCAVNYGSSPVNGDYPGGIVPGGVPGPAFVGMPNSLAAPINGNISCVDAGNDPAFNPTNTQPLTAMLWFKGYPADGRVQTLMSHGVTNWAMNLDGTTGHVVWNLYNGGNVTSTNVLNDGNWHMAAGVFDGTNSCLYVDGALNASGAASGTLASEAGAELFLGGSADYTLVGNNQRYFAGAIAQAALFTNALSADQIRSLYTVVMPPPATPTISLAYTNNQLVLTYVGTLISSTNVAGPYTPVTGAASPYSVPATNAQQFYRAKQ